MVRFRYGFARVEQEQEHEIGVQSQRGKDGRKEEKKKSYKKNKEGTGSEGEHSMRTCGNHITCSHQFHQDESF